MRFFIFAMFISLCFGCDIKEKSTTQEPTTKESITKANINQSEVQKFYLRQLKIHKDMKSKGEYLEKPDRSRFLSEEGYLGCLNAWEEVFGKDAPAPVPTPIPTPVPTPVPTPTPTKLNFKDTYLGKKLLLDIKVAEEKKKIITDPYERLEAAKAEADLRKKYNEEKLKCDGPEPEVKKETQYKVTEAFKKTETKEDLKQTETKQPIVTKKTEGLYNGTIRTGPRGGRYHISKNGNKVYESK